MRRPLADGPAGLPLRADLVAQQKRLRELEERVRKMHQAHWQTPAVEENETDGWLLSYLDLLTLLLVMFVALLAMSEPKDNDAAPPTATVRPATTTPYDWEAPRLPPVLVTSTADLPTLPWESRAERTWDELTLGRHAVPVAVPLPDFSQPDPARSVPSPAAPLTLDMPYTPVPALVALAPPRPNLPRPPAAEAVETPWSPQAPVGLPGPAGAAAEVTDTPEADPGPPLLPPNLDLTLLGDGVDVIVRERSVSFRISNELLFALGQVDLTPGGINVLKRVVEVLQGNDYPITVEGHTDPIPIRNDRFPSNWELSTFRATSVLRMLIDAGLDPTRLRATGYADTRPIADNQTNEGRALNRRVELILEMPTGIGDGRRP